MKKIMIITSRKMDDVNVEGKSFSGFVDLGCKNFEADVAYLSILGKLGKGEYPGRAYAEALGMGISPADEILAECLIASVDEGGRLDRAVVVDHDSLELIAEMLDGMEIDGAHFSVAATDKGLLLMVSGENLSADISPNYSSGGRDAVGQIIALNENAKRTASIFNRFITRSHKNLNSANLGIEPKPNIVLIRSVGRKTEKSELMRMKRASVCISSDSISRGIGKLLGMDIIDDIETNAYGLFSSYDIVWIDGKKLSLTEPPKEAAVATILLKKEKFAPLRYPAKVSIYGKFMLKKMIFERNELLSWLISTR
ncbi:MAG: hypothetical protein GXO64_02065 [Candidatus Micrarchaeota archaeon]|nr:hypothetical protein [Candidatus Micrarchaeota archaeon]